MKRSFLGAFAPAVLCLAVVFLCLTLTGAAFADGEMNPAEPNLLSVDEFLTLAAKEESPLPDCTFELFGQQVNTATTTRLDYLKVKIGDEGLDTFRAVLPYLPKLSYLSLDRCETTDEAVAQLRDEFPEKEIVWRIFFDPFTCMTDVETIWASCDLRDNTCTSLKYCTKLKNLDIGHSAMTDLSFLDYMPDLETLIIACSDFEDISHVASCKKLKYFECAECCRLTDLSPIAELKNLEHLNVGGCTHIEDLSCLYCLDECKNLKRFYAQNMTSLSLNMEEEKKKFEELLPGVEMDFAFYPTQGSLNTGFWRFSRGSYTGHYVEEYQRIRDIFGYDDVINQPRLWYG